MHRCLAIPEILWQIAQCVPAHSHTGTHGMQLRGATDLVSMACTCKLFYEPAMDVLWEELGDVDPLMACLPPWGGENHFIANAARVRKLHLVDLCFDTGRKLRQLEQYIPPSSVLLPNLRDLSLFEIQEADAGYVRMLLSPKLQSLWIGRVVFGVEKFLPCLPATCPLLEQLWTWSWPSEARAIVASLPHLREFGALKIDLPPLTKFHLSNSLSLRALRLVEVPSLSWDLTPTSFPSLTSLAIESIHDLRSVIRFLYALPTGTLEELEVEFTPGLPEAGMESEVMEVISRFQSLRQLALAGWDDIARDPRASPRYSMAPLLRLRELDTVSLRLGGMEHEITNTNIARLGAAWPKLSYFKFEQSTYRTMAPAGLTLEALGLFAAHCRALTHLGLELDASAKPGTPSPAESSRVAVTIELGGSLITEASWPWVAKYISAVYPNARLRVHNEGYKLDEDEVGYWRSVISVLPVMCKIRHEEHGGPGSSGSLVGTLGALGR